MTARRPNLFIVGAPKSGTTSLYAYLDGHPDVFMSPLKEPNFFSPDVKATLRGNPFKFPDETDKYLELYNAAHDEKAVGEASTSYLVSHQASGLVHDFAPDAHIIAMLRDPVDLIYSLHNERVANGAEPIADFEEAIRADVDRSNGRRLPPGFNELGAVYSETGMLGKQLKRWMDTFPRDQIHTILFRDFAADTPAEYRKVLEFIGVDATYRPAQFEVANKSWRRREGVVSMLVRSKPAQFARHRVVPALLGEQRAFKLSRGFTRSRLYRRKHDRPSLRPELRQELEARFAQDIELLGELIGRNLTREWLGQS